MTNQTIALEILRQLGQNRLIAMTGAKNFLSDVNALSFRLPSNFAKRGINYIKITLEPSDTYSVTFGKIRGINYTVIAERDGVYCDSLREVIRTETGLDLSL